jgi:hypothetical protein
LPSDELALTPEQARKALDFILGALRLTEWNVALHTYPSETVDACGTIADVSGDISTLGAKIRLALGAEDPFGSLVHECAHLLQSEMGAVCERAGLQLGGQAEALLQAEWEQAKERQACRLEEILVPVLRERWRAAGSNAGPAVDGEGEGSLTPALSRGERENA